MWGILGRSCPVVGDLFYRNTWVEVNLDRIEYNMKQIREKLPATSKIAAVVKADGYGHGAVEVAKRALASGASSLAVALLEEAIVLRESGITEPILVLSWVSPEAAVAAAKYNIAITIYQTDWIKKAEQLLTEDVNVHVKLDTGMGRAGIRTNEELKELLQSLKQSNYIKLTGVYTHFATADEANRDFFLEQRECFKQFITNFKQNWHEEITVHMANSAASIRYPEETYDMIRFGISMYGLYPSMVMKEESEIHLRQALSLHSRLIHVKKVDKGSGISYGSTYIAEKDEWIGTIPIGYGDGWIRKFQGADVLIDGVRCPIVGRICMDQMMVRLEKKKAIGEKVTLIGKQQEEVIEMDEVANYIETTSYEVPCMINERVPRIYVTDHE